MAFQVSLFRWTTSMSEQFVTLVPEIGNHRLALRKYSMIKAMCSRVLCSPVQSVFPKTSHSFGNLIPPTPNSKSATSGRIAWIADLRIKLLPAKLHVAGKVVDAPLKIPGWDGPRRCPNIVSSYIWERKVRSSFPLSWSKRVEVCLATTLGWKPRRNWDLPTKLVGST